MTKTIDLSPYYKKTIFSRLGDFWTKKFPDLHVTQEIVSALEDIANQAFIRIQEDVAIQTNIAQAPLRHVELWYAWIILENETDFSKANIPTYGNVPQVVYKPPENARAYGEGQSDIFYVRIRKPLTLDNPVCIVNHPKNPSYIAFHNWGFICDDEYCYLTINPFSDSRFSTFEINGAKAAILWLRLSEWDLQDFANTYAIPLGVPHHPSTEDYRLLCEGIWESRIRGPSNSALYKVISGLSGVPLCKSTPETVEYTGIDETTGEKIVVTDKNVYRFPGSHTLTVTKGTVLEEGQSFTQELQITSLDKLRSGQHAVLIPPEFFHPKIGIKHPITFPNQKVSVTYSKYIKKNRESVRFLLYGKSPDLKKYRKAIDSAGVHRLFNKLGPLQSFPSVINRVTEINPALLVKTFIRNNVLYVFGNKNTWPGEKKLLQQYRKILSLIYPAHGTIIIPSMLSSITTLSESSESILSSLPSLSRSFSSWSTASSRSSLSSLSLSSLSSQSLSSETSSSSISPISESTESTESSSVSVQSSSSRSSRSSQSFSSQSKSSVSLQSLSSRSTKSTESSSSSSKSQSSSSSQSTLSSKSTESSSTFKEFSSSSSSSESSESIYSESSASFSSVSPLSPSSESTSSESSLSESSLSSVSPSSVSPSSVSESSQSSKSSPSSKSSTSSYSAGYIASCGAVITYGNHSLQTIHDLIQPTNIYYDRYFDKAIYLNRDNRLWYIRRTTYSGPSWIHAYETIRYSILPFYPTAVLKALYGSSTTQLFPGFFVVFVPGYNPCDEANNVLDDRYYYYVKKLTLTEFSKNTINPHGLNITTLVVNQIIVRAEYTTNNIYCALVTSHTNIELGFKDRFTGTGTPGSTADLLNNYIFMSYEIHTTTGPGSQSVSSASSDLSTASFSSSFKFSPADLEPFSGYYHNLKKSHFDVFRSITFFGPSHPNDFYGFNILHFRKLIVTTNKKYIIRYSMRTHVIAPFYGYIWDQSINPITTITRVLKYNILQGAKAYKELKDISGSSGSTNIRFARIIIDLSPGTYYVGIAQAPYYGPPDSDINSYCNISYSIYEEDILANRISSHNDY